MCDTIEPGAVVCVTEDALRASGVVVRQTPSTYWSIKFNDGDVRHHLAQDLTVLRRAPPGPTTHPQSRDATRPLATPPARRDEFLVCVSKDRHTDAEVPQDQREDQDEDEEEDEDGDVIVASRAPPTLVGGHSQVRPRETVAATAEAPEAVELGARVALAIAPSTRGVVVAIRQAWYVTEYAGGTRRNHFKRELVALPGGGPFEPSVAPPSTEEKEQARNQKRNRALQRGIGVGARVALAEEPSKRGTIVARAAAYWTVEYAGGATRNHHQKDLTVLPQQKSDFVASAAPPRRGWQHKRKRAAT